MNTTRDKQGKFVKIHGCIKTKLYGVWRSMKTRCSESSCGKGRKHYFEKGIKVCDEWKNDFLKFKSWAEANGYKEGLSIDRIDGSKNYEPKNCRWISQKMQNRNYSRNHLITYKGETMCLADMADKYGINRATVLFRIKSGKTLDEVFDKNDRRYKNGKLF